tara:strand:+ start:168 stop:866 length:699 start_codon:yes stop_codon:yes gene_type:complete
MSTTDEAFQGHYLTNLSVHTVLFTIIESELVMCARERTEGPFRFHWELPGANPRMQESLEAAAHRSLSEIVHGSSAILQQLKVFGEPDRDPQRRSIAVCYWGAIAPEHLQPQPPVVSAIQALAESERFAFDHRTIAITAIGHLKRALCNSSVVTDFCPTTFSIRELHRVYEVVFGTEIAAGNFQRKVRSSPGFITKTNTPPALEKGRGRPAEIFTNSRRVEVSPPFHFPHDS